MLYFSRNGNKEQAALVRHAIETGGLDQIEAVQEAVVTSGAITYTKDAAQKASIEAIKALDKLPDTNYRDALKTLAEFSVNRSY